MAPEGRHYETKGQWPPGGQHYDASGVRTAGFERGEILDGQAHGSERRPAVALIAVIVGAAAHGQPPFARHRGVSSDVRRGVLRMVSLERRQARLDALRAALAVLALFALAGLFFTRGIPTTQPTATSAATAADRPSHQ